MSACAEPEATKAAATSDAMFLFILIFSSKGWWVRNNVSDRMVGPVYRGTIVRSSLRRSS